MSFGNVTVGEGSLHSLFELVSGANGEGDDEQ